MKYASISNQFWKDYTQSNNSFTIFIKNVIYNVFYQKKPCKKSLFYHYLHHLSRFEFQDSEIYAYQSECYQVSKLLYRSFTLHTAKSRLFKTLLFLHYNSFFRYFSIIFFLFILLRQILQLFLLFPFFFLVFSFLQRFWENLVLNLLTFLSCFHNIILILLYH